jgi:hypothetical protein
VSRARSGSFTDAETLVLLDRGATVRELAALEHVAPVTIYARLKRARAAGAMQTDLADALRAAVAAAEALAQELAR